MTPEDKVYKKSIEEKRDALIEERNNLRKQAEGLMKRAEEKQIEARHIEGVMRVATAKFLDGESTWQEEYDLTYMHDEMGVEKVEDKRFRYISDFGEIHLSTTSIVDPNCLHELEKLERATYQAGKPFGWDEDHDRE